MINKLIGFSIRNKAIIGLFILALIGWGVYSLKSLPMDALPDITNNQVQIHAIAPALAAQDVEQIITTPLEIAMANIPGLIEVRSISRFGLSVITLVFKDNLDIYRAREQVFQRIQEAQDQIPPGIATIGMAPISTGLGEIYQYTLQLAPGYEKKYSLTDLRTMQDWIIARNLEGTPGVAEINSFGGYIKQYEVAINPEKLRSLNVTLKDIFNALQQNNQNTGGAYIEKEENAYFIRGVGLVKTLEDIGNIVVKNNNGIPILIRDVANVRFGHAVRYGALTQSGRGEAVGGIVMMLRGENSMQVIKNVKEKIAVIQKSLPKGVEIKPFLDRSDLIDRAVSTISHNLIEGGLIVIFILILFLGNWRAGVVVASVIPLSLLFAISMMKLFGVSGNLMSLGAIDFGLVVDGAVIIVESAVYNIHHNIKLPGFSKLNQSQMDHEVLVSAKQMMNSASFGQIIILMVYIPILTLTGVEGKMFRPMAETVGFAIMGALVLCLTYVPMMSALLLSKRTAGDKRTIADKIMDFLYRLYKPIIHFALRKKAIIIISSVLLLVITFLAFSKMGGEFIPTLQEGSFSVEMRLTPGSSLSQTIKTTNRVEEILKKNFPEVTKVVSRIGVNSIPTDPDPMETAMITIILKDKSKWVTANNSTELADKMKEALSVIPGVNYEFSQPIQLRENELMSGIKQDVAVKIYGEDLDELTLLGNQAANIISTVKGAQDVLVEKTNGLPEITVDYNRSKIAQFGLTIADVNNVLESAFAGAKAGVVYEGDRRFDLVVRLDKEHREDISNVQNLFISLPNGNQVPLSEVASVKYKEGPSQISRDNTKRRIAIGLNIRNRDVQSVVNDIQKQLDAKLKLPPGYYITYGGQFQNLIDAKHHLMIVVPITLALILVLLFFTFGSITEALLIFTAIPFAAVGGVFALLLRGMPFSISAGVGFIALFGVAVLNGVVLISYFNQLNKEGIKNVTKRVLKGTHLRLRPVIITASVASVGFLPMALSTSAGAEVQRPLATVVIGGLITSTILTLIVLPVLYSIFTGGFKVKKINKMKGAAISILLLLCSVIPVSSRGQDAITGKSGQQPLKLSVNEAVEIALKNNPGIKSASYSVQQQEALKKTAVNIDKTGFVYTFDNTTPHGNSYVGIQQTFSFPTVYARQTKLQNQETLLSRQSLAVSSAGLVRNVRSAYYQMAYGIARLHLLVYEDSVYADFSKAAGVRYKSGETNYLESVAADAKYQEVLLLKKQAQADMEIYEQELQRWLNTRQPVQISASLEKLKYSMNTDSSIITQNPALKYYHQNINVARSQVSLERTGLLPDFTIGYNKQKVDGVNGYYGYQAGVNIPLWFRPQQGRIQAANIGVRIAEADYDNFRENIITTYSQQVEEYQKWLEQLNYYESTGLRQSDEILHTAEQNYKFGNISYVEYIQDVSQAFNIRLQYIDALNQYNQSIININYLLGR
ncbi:MAG: CusA/CzcA family heavy metal efflux RND transporter [Chitinophagaceae bacterium]|nr:MAG: CusA/CzcA family heavy metal efflux RND transporter [Chitinophagaceae bacterium]